MGDLLQKIVAGLIIFGAGQLVAGIRSYMSVMSKLKELELRITMVERQDDKIINKLDDLMESVQEVKLELSNKQNRL